MFVHNRVTCMHTLYTELQHTHWMTNAWIVTRSRVFSVPCFSPLSLSLPLSSGTTAVQTSTTSRGSRWIGLDTTFLIVLLLLVVVLENKKTTFGQTVGLRMAHTTLDTYTHVDTVTHTSAE